MHKAYWLGFFSEQKAYQERKSSQDSTTDVMSQLKNSYITYDFFGQ